MCFSHTFRTWNLYILSEFIIVHRSTWSGSVPRWVFISRFNNNQPRVTIHRISRANQLQRRNLIGRPNQLSPLKLTPLTAISNIFGNTDTERIARYTFLFPALPRHMECPWRGLTLYQTTEKQANECKVLSEYLLSFPLTKSQHFFSQVSQPSEIGSKSSKIGSNHVTLFLKFI